MKLPIIPAVEKLSVTSLTYYLTPIIFYVLRKLLTSIKNGMLFGRIVIYGKTDFMKIRMYHRLESTGQLKFFHNYLLHGNVEKHIYDIVFINWHCFLTFLKSLAL